MPVTLAEVLPLMRGHYLPGEMWAALTRLGPCITACARKLAPDADRAAFASETLSHLGLRIYRKGGENPPAGEPRGADYTGWLLVRVRSVALDLLRAERRRTRTEEPFDELTETSSTLTASPDKAGEPDEETSAAKHGTWDRLRQSSCPPNYRLALFAWYWPTQLAEGDLVAVAEQAQRGKSGQAAGLVRPVVRAWPLVVRLGDWRPQGIARHGPAEDRFAWIVRSETPGFKAWAEDRAELRRARETVGKWHLRARKWLTERHAEATQGEAEA